MRNIIFFLAVVSLLFVPILFVSADDTDYGSIIQEAATKGDASLCNKIDVPTGKDACILGVAVAIGDINLCDTMSEVSKMAYQDKICRASVTFDTKYCDEIDLSAIKTNCYSIVEENKKQGNIPPAQKPPVQQPSPQTKTECSSDDECGDNICSNGKCIEPKLTFVFVPVNWEDSLFSWTTSVDKEDFDKLADEQMELFLNATPLKNCRGAIKVVKSYSNCHILKTPKALNSDLLGLKTCSFRLGQPYDYVIGLAKDPYYDVDGISSELLGAALVNSNADISVGAHEIGHLFGLRDEYCNNERLWGSIVCGFDAQPNPLKTEEGCRKEDSPYDKDDFPDCCTSEELKADCSENVGLSESNAARKAHGLGVYETIEGLQRDNGYIYDNLNNCDADSVKQKIRGSLNSLKSNAQKLISIQSSAGFKFGERYNVRQKLDKLIESGKCSEDNDLCGCLRDYSGTYADFNKFATSNNYLVNIISFERKNIMGSGGGREFSRPAYDYLSTLPEMQCANDVPENPKQDEADNPSPIPSSGGGAGKVVVKQATISGGNYGLACAESFLTNKIYCFGGSNGTSQYDNIKNYIFEYDPVTDSVSIKQATLQVPLTQLACISQKSSGKIYCFGGQSGMRVYSKRIFVYDPIADEVIIKNANLPYGNTGLSCAENSATNKIYCFGGQKEEGKWAASPEGQIFEYDPDSDVLEVKSSELLSPRELFSCVEYLDKNIIYCFGGSKRDIEGIAVSNEIIKYEPSQDNITTIKSTLPNGVYGLSCTENKDTHRIYCFGGREGYGYSGNYKDFNNIIEFNPVTDALPRIKSTVMPTPEYKLSCVWSSAVSKIYCFGGINGTNSDNTQEISNSIFEYTP